LAALLSREHVVDAGDAAVFAADHGEPLQREGRPGTVSQQVLETLKIALHVAVDERYPDAGVNRKPTVLSSEHGGGRIGVEEPLYAEPPHDTTAHLLGERGQIRLGDRPKVRRFVLSSFAKRALLVRLITQSIFMLQAAIAVLVRSRPDVIVASTSPPFAGAGAALLSWARNVPLVWWVMDINPDQLIATGRMRDTFLPARVFDALSRITLAQAARVIALDRFMGDRLVAKQSCAEKRFLSRICG